MIGYSLEQMYLALERYADEIRQGDLVIFAPISADLERSLVGRLYVCGGMIRAEANEVFPRLDGRPRVYRAAERACNFVLDWCSPTRRCRSASASSTAGTISARPTRR